MLIIRDLLVGPRRYTDLKQGLPKIPTNILSTRWGFAQMGEPGPDDVVTADSLTMALRTAFQPDAAASLPSADYEVHVGDVVLRVHVDGGELRIAGIVPESAQLKSRK